MTNKTKAAIEEAAKRHAYNCDPDNVNPPKWADHYFSFKAGVKEAIEHPERYGLTARKQIGIQEARELVNQMLAEEISFSRFVELINEGGTD